MTKYNSNRKHYWAKLFIHKKLKAIEYKGGKCQDCGYDKYYGALEFHHRNPNQKEFVWSTMRNKAWATILNEIDKCDLLCSNCHKERHSNSELLEDIKNWRDCILKKKISIRKCPRCKINFKPYQDKIKYCSKNCAVISSQKIDWPKNLKELVESSSKRAIAKELGVSDKAVAKRLKKVYEVYEV